MDNVLSTPESIPETCIECKQRFTPINDDGSVVEYRCTACQAAYRIAEAKDMHRKGEMVSYKKPRYTGLWAI